MTPAYILHHGRTLFVVARVKTNGIPHVAVMETPDKLVLIPVAKAIAAPVRSRPVLIVDNTKHGG